MTGFAGPAAEAVFCAVLLCAAALARALTERDGPRRVRLLLASESGSVTRVESSWRSRAQQFGDVLRSRLRPRTAAPTSHDARLPGGRPRVGGLVGLVTRAGRAWWCLPAGALVGLWAGSAVPAVLGAVAVPWVSRVRRSRRARAETDDTARAVIDLCAATAGELRSGRLPDGALLAAGAGCLGREGAALLAAARFGGDVPTALERAARLPGAEGLRGVAACWRVSADGGAGLADGLDRVANALRAERDQREELRSQLAGPRATATVLALLPAFGLLLGTAMGADPLAVLLHTPVGLACLTAGGMLEWTGLAWVARLVRVAEEGP